MNNRRRLVIALGAFVPGTLFAQAKTPPILIGWLGIASPEKTPALTWFREGMAALGWKEGSNYAIEERWAGSQSERLPDLAREIIAKRPAVIVAYPLASIIALSKSTSATPLVQANGGDPVAVGLAKSLARPGGMVTGLINVNLDIGAKHVELLVIASPHLRRLGFLADPGVTNYAAHLEGVRRAVAQFKVEAQFAEAKKPEDLERAINKLAQEKIQGLVIMTGPWFSSDRSRILNLALSHRWAVVGDQASYAEAGALVSYGASRSSNFRRAAYYVDRILKGAKPADLPIEQPTTFETAVNLKTAKALGLTMPPEIMVRATHVIQ